MKKELQPLAEMLVDEFYTLVVSVKPEFVHFILARDNAVAYEHQISAGEGMFAYQDVRLANINGLCRTLSDFLKQKEKDIPLGQDASRAKNLLARMQRDAGIPQYMVQGYFRLAESLSLPPFETLGDLTPEQFTELDEHISSFERTLEPGIDICITNLAAFQPLRKKESGIEVYVFDPKIENYQTAVASSYDFRNTLREHSQGSNDC